MSELDYQAIAEGLQHELEQARLEILRMRFSHRPFLFHTSDIKKFVNDNYLVIIVAFFLIDTGWKCIRPFTGQLFNHRSKHDA